MSLALDRRDKAAPKPPTQRSLCIHEMFELQAGRTPEAIAVNCGNEALTYKELNERASQLAAHLKNLGVAPEIPVALFLERSINMVVAILGVLKAGGAYVPVDLAYPKDRLSFMLEDSQAPILITQQNLLHSLPKTTAKIISIDSVDPNPSLNPNPNLNLNPTPSNAAYIIYTSGSTGKPKGVIVTHNNVVRLLTQTAHWYNFNPTDVWPLFHSYAFDVSVWELWGALFYGGRLVIVPYLTSRSPYDFYELLSREKVTVLNQTPSAFRQLIWAETSAETKLPLNLRYVICAGEALELQSLKPWFDLHGDERPEIVNKYGITEITVHATYRMIRKSDLSSGVGSVIGVPIPDLQIYLVDEDLKPVPNGTPGEICVGGAGVARGYLNRPELTSQRFLPDPFSDQPGVVLYRSGDLAQISATGEMEYLGRMDHQVKIRGFRVELGEIESGLNRHPAIRESVVIAQEGTGGDKRLVAYVVPATRNVPTVTELRAHLSQSVPDYMLPTTFVFLDALPLTTNGKVDRRALPAPDGARPHLKAAFVAPKNQTEQILADIWREVLGIDQVGIQDNFFELGGDSIRSITVLSKAHQKGINLALQHIFQSPTVAGLAACAEHASPKTDQRKSEPFSLVTSEDRSNLPPDVEDAYPLTRLQLGMFYHNELNPASAIYHDVFSFHIRSAFDRQKLEQAVNRLVERHPVLRTSFRLSGFRTALQLVHRKVQAPFTVDDVRHRPADAQSNRILDWVEAEKRRPFDRTTAPLIRVHVQLQKDDAFQFFLSFHHVCLDGWSLAAVMTEIMQDYAALQQGNDANIAPPRIRYRDFVGLEQQSIASEETRRFWQQKFADANFQPLPRWPKSYCIGGQEQTRGPELFVEPEVLEQLKHLSQLAGVPLKTVLLAAHQRVMGFLYGKSDVTSGLLCNGRPEEIDGEKLVGLFLNTLPIRQQLSGGTWLELIKQTFAAEQEIIPHRRFPMAEVQKLNGGKPLFEAAFDFVHFHVYKNLEGRPDLDFAEGHYFEANDLPAFTTFMLDTASAQLQMHIEYDPNVLCRQQVEEFSNFYLTTLRAMTADPQGRYDNFSPLSPAQKQQILVDWNATQADYPRDKCIHELFESRARENPNAIAVSFENETLTYRELDRQADLLAQRLNALKAGPDVLVGICLERSPRMLIGLLAILKTGAAYVPLDPTFPKERLASMLEDAQVPILLTENPLLPTLPTTTAQTLCIEDICWNHESAERPQTDSASRITHHASRLSYVIFTSGSTGKPKAVQVPHSAVVNLLLSAAKTIGFTSSDVLLAVTTLSFDIAALELFMPLVMGGTVALATREKASDGSQLAALLESSHATVMQGTPATWRLLIDSGWTGNPKLKILCGGEALKRNLADELLKRATDVWNFFGPTETTIWSTAWKVVPDQPISIGRPLANTQLYILGSNLQPLPIGAIGELHIGGEGLACGYLNRPDLTTEKFIPNPFVPPLPGERAGVRGNYSQPNRRPSFSAPHLPSPISHLLYKTGDLARYLPDGTVECLGRIDHQVKIRGFRIELGEVESVLRQHPGIADALVTARDDRFGEKRLVGYIISKNGPPSVPEIRDFVRTKLPHYMVPAHLVVLQEFPLSTNGKVDLRRLPSPETSSEPVKNYVAPRTDDEQALAKIWQEVLMVPQVGIEDNFFDLGGDSLSATRAYAHTNQTLSTQLTLRELFEHPTIASLASILRTTKNSSVSAAPILPRRTRRLTALT